MKKSATMKDLLLALTENMSAEEILSADIISSLSNAIAKKRIGLDMTQAELAASIGKKQSTISKWENGDMNFTVRLLAEIAQPSATRRWGVYCGERQHPFLSSGVYLLQHEAGTKRS